MSSKLRIAGVEKEERKEKKRMLQSSGNYIQVGSNGAAPNSSTTTAPGGLKN